MRETECELLIVGGGTGGVAAALAATSMGLRTILTEECDWIGGQLTSQLVPPDEHRWIESFGCTRRYRAYREGVRRFYRDHTPLLPGARENPRLNPGSGWVSRLCHEPRIGWLVLQQMLLPSLASGLLDIRLRTVPIQVGTNGDRIFDVQLESEGEREWVIPQFVIDATELGDVLALAEVAHRLGAENIETSGEPHAIDGPDQGDNLQGITWCFAMAHDEGSNRTISRPEGYSFWREYRPAEWPGPLLGFDVLAAHTGEVKQLPLFSDDWYQLFTYRQVIDPSLFADGFHPHPVTIVNWPQNDYYLEPPIPMQPPPNDPLGLEQRAKVYAHAKELSMCLLYWLQTEAPRHDGGVGYPGLYLRPDVAGTRDGFAQYPYIRESRRLEALRMVSELDVAADLYPGAARAPKVPDSVGIGAYRLDLHPGTNGARTIDLNSLPFQIPLSSLTPLYMENLLPAAKNLGVTHIANGCYRLHPVEWNIGEAAAIVAGYCLHNEITPQGVCAEPAHVALLQRWLADQGIEIDWPELGPL
jgi:hypothetical protein